MRALKPSEIEVRVGGIKTNPDGSVRGLRLLLFKEARSDMGVLDEEFGPMGWKREHTMIGGYLTCTVSVYDRDKKEWVSKQDVGSSDNRTENEKTAFSDSFKRACVSWGIGRELYTAPTIWVRPEDFNAIARAGKVDCFDIFKVSEIEYSEGRIVGLEIVNMTKNGKEVFSWKEEK